LFPTSVYTADIILGPVVSVVGLGVGVSVGDGVAVGLGVAVGDMLGVGVIVGLIVAEGLTVGLAVAAGVTVGLGVGVAVDDTTAKSFSPWAMIKPDASLATTLALNVPA